MIRVAINGFGRIGRCFLRAAMRDGANGKAFEIVALNDLGTLESLAYLLKYDTVYGKADFEVMQDGKNLIVNGKPVAFVQEKELTKLPWKDMNIDIVVESTGVFTDPAKAHGHIDAGAKRVVISAPAKGEGAETVLIGANEEKLKTCTISSNASCTTNAASPLIGILDEVIGIEKALLNTTHAYTASQELVDAPNAKDLREGRAAAQNMVPASTGAAKATALAYPQMKDRFDGIAVRVPVPAGSMVDVTFIAKRATTPEEVNAALKAAAASDRWKKVFAVTEEPLVSSDILGLPFGSIADLALTRVVGGNLVKVMAWYDNEMGYAHTLVEHVSEAAKSV
ncbi:type I glyceraldehyde-3-phosphate dehydrogenase [Candidatus Kaiserbacteria bacterium RIFCSPHIGHO2_01_FULL_56_24]|uniref:Type I glyceraldehyde-3-phosphate dehydrogenase n=1 Tax=Candidatus Kaiserbacteria bacterium RIFCSPHIGHO2_01_FULL_56_24 TaxID=1798487 RepID=A0A1F6DAC9_9BACT|nr:MAG: type I glyceraldehyde-3-phosphate dehydrogenase [Candidatus Kaiserbacteria bacterium RIFCSPHIGHO2_01_FULL_56_24]